MWKCSQKANELFGLCFPVIPSPVDPPPALAPGSLSHLSSISDSCVLVTELRVKSLFLFSIPRALALKNFFYRPGSKCPLLFVESTVGLSGTDGRDQSSLDIMTLHCL